MKSIINYLITAIKQFFLVGTDDKRDRNDLIQVNRQFGRLFVVPPKIGRLAASHWRQDRKWTVPFLLSGKKL